MVRDPLLRLDAVSKIFDGGTVGLHDVDLDIGHGEFVSLLGPSGCGKTTSLRLMAGFEQPTSGRVLLDGQDITALRPYDRPLNTVFQDYALFPHMDVAENVGFGLTLRKVSGAEISRKVKEALDLVGLGDKIHARVSMLSGGQRQRVALARALVCSPRVLLLDEPLSALDANLREQMQIELKRLQARLGTTFVMVTHDQTEALSISDRIVVMNRGKIEQIASPAELYDAPATRFVAHFIGTMNLIEGKALETTGEFHRVAAGPMTLEVPADGASAPAPGAPVLVCIRPEELSVVASPSDDAVAAQIMSTVFYGPMLRLFVEIGGGQKLMIDTPRRPAAATIETGAFVHVRPNRGSGRILNGE
ncbi:ABC transporter ATP-binding protein [Hyphomicrobium sp. ghe19]|uniref:ABC transporter ATP-binding protein n=1 Tax=Hyphomicrobium sp. ghe19 TaxID=2682968 RepID=UPI00136698A5|nr:Spermidine/putrescine import ATP-binding protein PotA [Hyphomicrobium sp. ghe19]